ncbi:MAG: helix-turn-helix domain-containing protein [Acidobacteria bacterium]|nr:helix-turn-helix domain-containing protein [Acidobacteriota bacterium]
MVNNRWSLFADRSKSMHLKIPDNENYRHFCTRQVGKLRIGKTLYRRGDWNAEHFHENARFVFVLSGTFAENYGGKTRLCRPETGIFRPPHEKHSEIYEDGVICISVDIQPSWLKNIEKYSVKLENSNSIRSRSLGRLITKVSDEMEFDDDVSALALESLLTEAAVEMYRNFSEVRQSSSPDWLKHTVEYIHANYSDNLSLGQIASVSNVHPVHLSRVFRNTYHCTVAEYIRGLRVRSARDLLLRSDMTLAQIAVHVGFADQSHFTKIFKRLTHHTPAQFKKLCD